MITAQYIETWDTFNHCLNLLSIGARVAVEQDSQVSGVSASGVAAGVIGLCHIGSK